MADYYYYTGLCVNDLYGDTDYMNRLQKNAILNYVKNEVSINDYYKYSILPKLTSYINLGNKMASTRGYENTKVLLTKPSTAVSDYYTPATGEEVVAITSCSKWKTSTTPDMIVYVLYLLQNNGYTIISANRIKKNNVEYTFTYTFTEANYSNSTPCSLVITVSDGTIITNQLYTISMDSSGLISSELNNDDIDFNIKLVYYIKDGEYKVKLITNNSDRPSSTVDSSNTLKTMPICTLKESYYYIDAYTADINVTIDGVASSDYKESDVCHFLSRHNRTYRTWSIVSDTKYKENKRLLKKLDINIDDILDSLRESDQATRSFTVTNGEGYFDSSYFLDSTDEICDSIFLLALSPFNNKPSDTDADKTLKSDKTYKATANVLFHLFYTLCNGLYIGNGLDYYTWVPNWSSTGISSNYADNYSYAVIVNSILIKCSWLYASYHIYTGTVSINDLITFSDDMTYATDVVCGGGSDGGCGVTTETGFKNLYIKKQITDDLYAEIGLLGFHYAAYTYSTDISASDDYNMKYGYFFKEVYANSTELVQLHRNVGGYVSVKQITLDDTTKYNIIIPLLQDSLQGLTVYEKISILSSSMQLMSFGFDEQRVSTWSQWRGIVTLLVGVVLSVLTTGLYDIIRAPITIGTLTAAQTLYLIGVSSLALGIINMGAQADGSLGMQILATIANVVVGAAFATNGFNNFNFKLMDVCKLANVGLDIWKLVINERISSIQNELTSVTDIYNKKNNELSKYEYELNSGLTDLDILNANLLGCTLSPDTLYEIALNGAYKYELLYDFDSVFDIDKLLKITWWD